MFEIPNTALLLFPEITLLLPVINEWLSFWTLLLSPITVFNDPLDTLFPLPPIKALFILDTTWFSPITTVWFELVDWFDKPNTAALELVNSEFVLPDIIELFIVVAVLS